MPDTTACDICAQPLGAGAKENVCRSCLVAGSAWAHRHIIRLWNLGMDRSEIAQQLGYSPATVTTLVLRLRARGADIARRNTRGPHPRSAGL